MVFKTKKRKKSKGQRGNTTYGHGARKQWHSSGDHGGCGMAGTGKRADHKKSLVIKLYGNSYFGKQGVTSRSTEHIRNDVMNLKDIEKNFDSLMEKYGKGEVLDLKEYKILGDGEFTRKVTIIARGFTQSAKEKIEKNGGKAEIREIVKKSDSDKKVEKKEVKKKPAKKKTE